MSVPNQFRKGFDQFEADERSGDVNLLTASRVENAKAAWRIARYVPDYDRIGFWPHLHEPHDELVGPMNVAKIFGLGAGAVFSTMLVEQYLTDPTLATYTGAVATFLGISFAAEGALCAWKPIPARFKAGPRSVVALGLAASVPLVTWLLMRAPNTVFGSLAQNWEGVTLIGVEVTLLLFGAAAGATARALRWSRKHYGVEVQLRERLIALGAEPADVPATEAEAATE